MGLEEFTNTVRRKVSIPVTERCTDGSDGIDEWDLWDPSRKVDTR